ncbi:acetyl-CoA carboxylase biotin carboxyl carrier protein [Pedobacter sp. UYP30]|uniref:acetyl-CoA carboxylase biotin carboxyl carrier protein n=1 Tax=Pedobacter sp. UYP30 TaxID=1756400 RepID=UPI00339969E1
MDIKQIQDLIKFVAKSGVNEVAIEQENFKITIKTNQEQTVVHANMPQMPLMQAAAPGATTPTTEIAPGVTKIQEAEESNYITIKSPMIGTFYRSSSPDKPMFINVGDEVSPGKVVCIIEAMKLFNEIESEVSGRVVKILVDNSSPIEYDQPLFLVEPI